MEPITDKAFAVAYDWLPIGSGDSAEQATFAEMTINIDSKCATRVEDLLAKSVRSSVRLSAYCLAEWFAFNWWRLLWEPKSESFAWRESHKVGNAGRGFVWPNLEFSSDWNTMLVSCRDTEGREFEPVRYLNNFNAFVSLSDFEKAIEGFISGTIARLASIDIRQSDLETLWNDVLLERNDPGLSGRRSLEACMGYDPDEAPAELIESLLDQKNSFGPSALQEMAAVCKQETLSKLDDIYESSQKTVVDVTVPSFEDIRNQITQYRHSSVIPWRRAEIAADTAREIWGLSAPVSREQLSDLFGITRQQFFESASNGQRSLMAGFRDNSGSGAFRVSWSSDHPTSRRFALMRLVADHLTASTQDRLLPGTQSATNRQKFQRAFAQEFLCPVEALKEYLGDGVPSYDDISEAAAYFDVSPLTVRNILVNKGLVEREALEGWVA